MTSGDVVGSVIAKAQDSTRVGTVAELWRYPVKSMLGSMVSELFMTRNGAIGDCAWALKGSEERQDRQRQTLPAAP